MSKERSVPGCLLTGVVIFAVCFFGAWMLKEHSPTRETPDLQTDPTSGLSPVPAFLRRAMTLAPGVHLLGELSPSAVYVVETDAGLVLIDTGFDADAGHVSSQLADLGMSVDQLHSILLTHIHADHSLGARLLQKLSGATIYAGADDSDELEAGESREAFLSTFDMPDVVIHSTQVDERLVDGQVLDFGNARLQCIATPGHTPGSFCFLLEKNKQRILFTGDTVSSRTGDLGTYAAHLSPRYRSNAVEYLDSLRKLRDMASPHLLLPGHPAVDREGQSAEVSTGEWHELLDRGIKELEDLVVHFEADGRDFLDGTPKRILRDLFYLGEFHEWALYCLQTQDRLFVFDAPSGPGLDAFLRERLSQLEAEIPTNIFILLTACDEAATAGLSDLLDTTDCTVVAPAKALPELQKSYPEGTRFMTIEDLEAKEWFPVSVLPLTTLGTSPVAFEVTWEGKTVLIPGRIPTCIGEGSIERLKAELKRLHGDPKEYLTSLRLLRKLDPDIWLPASPIHGQNANLYENQWRAIILANRNAFTPRP